jgi:hypothetical protein
MRQADLLGTLEMKVDTQGAADQCSRYLLSGSLKPNGRYATKRMTAEVLLCTLMVIDHVEELVIASTSALSTLLPLNIKQYC